MDSTLSFIRSNPGKPFFINFFPNEVHDPYNPIDGTEKEFASVTSNLEQQKFLATLKEMDRQIGRLMEELEKMGRLKNTIVLLTSDNGPTDWPRYYKDGGEPPCSAGDLHGRKWSLYEGGIRVPFIAVWPGKIPEGSVDDKNVLSVVDLVPTVARLTGSKLSPGYVPDGRDVSDVLMGKKPVSQKDLYWYYNNNPIPGKKENVSPTLAILSGDWKLLMDPNGSKLQLYNLREDHRETRDVSGQQKAIAKQLSAKLQRWHTEFVK